MININGIYFTRKTVIFSLFCKLLLHISSKDPPKQRPKFGNLHILGRIGAAAPIGRFTPKISEY